jgi:hypothetical protein
VSFSAAAAPAVALPHVSTWQVEGSSHYNEFMSGHFLNTNLTGGYGTPFGGCLGGTYVYDAYSAAARNATFQVCRWRKRGALYNRCSCVRLYDGYCPCDGACQGWMNGYGRYGIRTAWHDCSEPGRNNALDGSFRCVEV